MFGKVAFIGRGAALLALCALAACASRPPASNPAARAAYDANHDPLEPANRAVFKFNTGFDKAILRPTAVAWRKVAPPPVRTAAYNFISNWYLPFVSINEVLQLQPGRAATTVGRFAVNTTVGVGGLMDPATKWHLDKHDEDLGQTFAVWGIGGGPYLMVPFVGPSNPRDLTGRTIEFFYEPVGYYLSQHGYSYEEYAMTAVNVVGFRERNMGIIDSEARNSVDYYATVRAAYWQHRCVLIHNGDSAKCAPKQQEDDFPADFDQPAAATKAN